MAKLYWSDTLKTWVTIPENGEVTEEELDAMYEIIMELGRVLDEQLRKQGVIE